MFRFVSVLVLIACFWTPNSYTAENRVLKIGVYHMWTDEASVSRAGGEQFLSAKLRVALSLAFFRAGADISVYFVKPLPPLKFSYLEFFGGKMRGIPPPAFFKAVRAERLVLRDLATVDFLFIFTPDMIIHQPMKIDLVDEKSGEAVSGMMYNALGGIAERSGQVALIRFDENDGLFRNRIIHETGHLLGLKDKEGEECRKNLSIMCWPVRPEMKMDDQLKMFLQKYPGKMRIPAS